MKINCNLTKRKKMNLTKKEKNEITKFINEFFEEFCGVFIPFKDDFNVKIREDDLNDNCFHFQIDLDFSNKNIDLDICYEFVLDFNVFATDFLDYDYKNKDISDFFDEKVLDLDEVFYSFYHHEFEKKEFLSNNNAEAIREKVSCLFTKRFKNKFL
jgi:hypothetical protein